MKTNHPYGFEENRTVARQGGKIAGDARKELEKKTRKKVVSPTNYLPERKTKKIEGSSGDGEDVVDE